MDEKHAQRLGIPPGEIVVSVVRRHWWRVAVEGFFALALWVALAVVVGVGEFLLHASGTPVSPALALGTFALAGAGLLLWTRFFLLWSDHWLDVWIITDRRVIDIEQKGFFSRQVSSFSHDRIQDVTYEVAGLISTWLHIGNVRIQTASVSTDFVMRQVPNPDLVKEEIQSVVARTRREPPVAGVPGY